MHGGEIAQGLIAAAQQETPRKGRFDGDEAIEAVHGQAQALQLGDRQSPSGALCGGARAAGTAQHCQALSFAQAKVIAHELQGCGLAVLALEEPRQLVCRLTQDWHFGAGEKPAVRRMASAMLPIVGHGNLMQQ
jgi:hypothetical protein